MTDFFVLLFDWLLSNRLLRWLICGSVIALTFYIAGFNDMTAWKFIGAVSLVFVIFEVCDIFGIPPKR